MGSTGKGAFILRMKWTQVQEKHKPTVGQDVRRSARDFPIFTLMRVSENCQIKLEHQKKDEQWAGLCQREVADETKAFVVGGDG